ncbi:MAG: response regulator [Calditrichaeota bacterium]|nr:response regulator [Calditrichota bacterium]
MTVTPRVLVVDDDEGFRDLISSVLISDGCDVQAAESGPVALGVMPLFQPHIVLLDVIMPEMSGLETLRQIRKLDSSVKVVMVSGWHDLGVVKEAVELGAAEFLNKPFDAGQLKSFVRREVAEMTG